MGRSIAKHGSNTAAISYFKVKFQRKSTAPSHKLPVFPKAVFIITAIIILEVMVILILGQTSS